MKGFKEMGLDAFLERALKLKFSKLSSYFDEKIKQKEIYKRFSDETGWSCIKDIDKENLELLNDESVTLNFNLQ